jgi:hypothetical protein
MTGYNITNGTLVGDVFKHGDTVDVFPELFDQDINQHFTHGQ